MNKFSTTSEIQYELQKMKYEMGFVYERITDLEEQVNVLKKEVILLKGSECE